MHRTFFIIATFCLAPAALAQDNTTRNMAASCAICHGTNGKAVTGDVVALAGRSREQIATEMRAFRDGQRRATVMHQVAKGYSDAEIDALAAWFAAQKR